MCPPCERVVIFRNSTARARERGRCRNVLSLRRLGIRAARWAPAVVVAARGRSASTSSCGRGCQPTRAPSRYATPFAVPAPAVRAAASARDRTADAGCGRAPRSRPSGERQPPPRPRRSDPRAAPARPSRCSPRRCHASSARRRAQARQHRGDLSHASLLAAWSSMALMHQQSAHRRPGRYGRRSGLCTTEPRCAAPPKLDEVSRAHPSLRHSPPATQRRDPRGPGGVG